MRTLMRGLGLSCALALAGALGLAACNQQSSAPTETATTPSDEEREAEIAAQQLAALGGAASAEQRALYTGDFQASGGAEGEGVWELRLLEDYAQFSRPGLGDDGGVTDARDYHAGGMRVVAGPITITIMQQQCDASGTALPYTAHVLFEGVAYEGCARRGIDEGAGRSTWASVLPELIPAIDACLTRARSRPARVTFASSIDEGQVSVRLREANGSRNDCVADSSGAVVVFEPVSDLDRRAGEGDPEFQRGGTQPRGTCVQAATSSTGEELGWLVRRSC